MSSKALVSCLMVTKPRRARFSYLQDSISAYLRQTYQPCELVIVLDETEDDLVLALQRHLATLARPDIRLFLPQGPASLGALRNRSVEVSVGDILCQWDDDDFHHPDRVRRQAEVMSADNSRACYLQDVLQFMTGTRTLFWTNWMQAPVPAHPGTLMCARTQMVEYPATGPQSQREEDRHVLQQLIAAGPVSVVTGEPHLFVYRMHSENLSPQGHLQMLVETLAVSASFLRRREAALRAELAVFDFGPGDVTVTGSNGAAFTIPGQGASRP